MVCAWAIISPLIILQTSRAMYDLEILSGSRDYQTSISTEIVVDGNTALHVVVVVMAIYLDEIFKEDSYQVY